MAGHDILTIGILVEQLTNFAATVPDDTPVRLNGAYAHQLALNFQVPLADVPSKGGFRELRHDKGRAGVVDIITDGSTPEELPRITMDTRSLRAMPMVEISMTRRPADPFGVGMSPYTVIKDRP